MSGWILAFCGGVTADESSARVTKYRVWLERYWTDDVVAAACGQAIPGSAGMVRVDILAVYAPQQS